MYIDRFTTWLDTRAKYVLMADKTRHQIDRRSGCRPATGDQQLRLGTEQIWTNDPRIDFADLTRRYHEYVDTHTLANFLVKHGSHEFLWGRPVQKVDTWQAVDCVWLQVVFADNGECQRISSREPYIRKASEGRQRGDFIGFYLDVVGSAAVSHPTPHDFTQLIVNDLFLGNALQLTGKTPRIEEYLSQDLWYSLWEYHHPVITYTFRYSFWRQSEGKIGIRHSRHQDD
jgi:hypothetical protein